ncbi:MAG: hypothetical protein R3E32_20020 [Chitinophagales bacterium]
MKPFLYFFLIILFAFLGLSTSFVLAQTGLKSSGDIQHLKDKINKYDATQLAAIQQLYPNATLKALNDAMQEVAFLKDGEKYVPPINEPDNGCVGGGIGRGVGYLGNMSRGEDVVVVDDSVTPELGQNIADEILKKLKEKGLFDDDGAGGKPTQWAEAKREVTHEKERQIGRDIETYVFDFPTVSGTSSTSVSTNYTQPTNIQSALDMIGKALKNRHVVEFRINNGTGCGTTSFHFALAYRIVEFKGFDGLYGLSFVDDGKQDGTTGQGDDKPENYERGLYLFDKNGNCLNAPKVKISHFFVEKFKK